MKKYITVTIFIFLTGMCLTVKASELEQIYNLNGVSYSYKRPSMFDPFKRIIPDFKESFGIFTDKSALLPAIVVVTSTAALICFDQELLDGAISIGDDLNINSKDMTTAFITIGDIEIFRGPTDLGSAMYFIGDGWLHGSMMAGFLTYGLLKDDNRALQTASQLAEGLLTTGIATQVLKHITGRESPYRSTEDGGNWDFFPDQIEYHKHVPKYDAFPSGHLATAMMTFTVITENYPEYNSWAKPLGWTLLGLLSYQMMNNSVHWASDYPLAIAMGYGFGQIAVGHGRTNLSLEKTTGTFSLKPVYKNEALGLGLSYDF